MQEQAPLRKAGWAKPVVLKPTEAPDVRLSKNEKQNNDEDDSAETDIHLQLLSFQC